MRSSSPRFRLLLVAVPTMLAGCFGSRRQATPAGQAIRPESAVVVQKADSVKDSLKKVTEPTKTAVDSAALATARADSIAKANRVNRPIADSAAKNSAK